MKLLCLFICFLVLEWELLLQVFDDPKWKLEIVIQYLTKYIPKVYLLFDLLVYLILIFSNKWCSISFWLQPSVRTRRSNTPQGEDLKTLNGILKTFSNGTNAKNITKKIGPVVVQILIGHGFLVINDIFVSPFHILIAFLCLLVPKLTNLSSGSAHNL